MLLFIFFKVYGEKNHCISPHLFGTQINVNNDNNSNNNNNNKNNNDNNNNNNNDNNNNNNDDNNNNGPWHINTGLVSSRE